jgi:hypothetical protein
VAELDHVFVGVADVDAGAEVVIDLEHMVAVLAPAIAMAIEVFERWCIERNVVHPPRQTGMGVDVNWKLVADLFVVNLPERDHACIALWCGDNECIGALKWWEESRKNRDRYLIDWDRLNTVRWQAVMSSDDTRTYWLRAGAVTALIAIAFQSIFDFTLQMPGAAALFEAHPEDVAGFQFGRFVGLVYLDDGVFALLFGLEDFQRSRRLSVDGVAGVQTQLVLDAALGAPGTPRLADTGTEAGA